MKNIARQNFFLSIYKLNINCASRLYPWARPRHAATRFWLLAGIVKALVGRNHLTICVCVCVFECVFCCVCSAQLSSTCTWKQTLLLWFAVVVVVVAATVASLSIKLTPKCVFGEWKCVFIEFPLLDPKNNQIGFINEKRRLISRKQTNEFNGNRNRNCSNLFDCN